LEYNQIVELRDSSCIKCAGYFLSFNLGEIKLSSMVAGGFVMRTDMAILT